MPTDLPELLRPEEAAEMLRISYSTLRRLIRQGDLRAVRLGRSEGASLRIPRDELARLVAPSEGEAA
jgi:excisionase family DNA binding protein